jgi:hypothetical protein
MIFRAIFFIALVALLMPREPDIGLGRPGASSSNPALPNRMLSNIALPGLATLRSLAGLPPTRSLADVKAEIDASIGARGETPFSL